MKNRKSVCCILIALNLALIWGNSALPGDASTELSDGFLALLVKILPVLARIGPLVIRKLAHFTEFACLGLLLAWFFRLMGQRGFHRFSSPALPGMLAACVDETIQIFVPGRGSSLMDVWIDFGGVCVGILLLHLGYCCIRRRKNHDHHLEENL